METKVCVVTNRNITVCDEKDYHDSYISEKLYSYVKLEDFIQSDSHLYKVANYSTDSLSKRYDATRHQILLDVQDCGVSVATCRDLHAIRLNSRKKTTKKVSPKQGRLF